MSNKIKISDDIQMPEMKSGPRMDGITEILRGLKVGQSIHPVPNAKRRSIYAMAQRLGIKMRSAPEGDGTSRMGRVG